MGVLSDIGIYWVHQKEIEEHGGDIGEQGDILGVCRNAIGYFDKQVII